MRRLLGPGGPPRGEQAHRLGGGQRLPGPGRGTRRSGDRHLRRAGHRRRTRYAARPAPGAGGDGATRRLPVRLLHAGIHLQHGGRVLPAQPLRARGPGGQRQRRRRRRAWPQRFRSARAERKPVPLHRLPPHSRRRVRRGDTCRRGPAGAASRAGPARTGRHRIHPGRQHLRTQEHSGRNAAAAARAARRGGPHAAPPTGASR